MTDGTKTVTTAGTAVPLSSSSLGVGWLAIQSRSTNAGDIVLGGSTVVAASGAGRRGIVVPEASSVGAGNIHPMIIQGPLDLADIYLDATDSGDGVHYVYA